MTEARPRILVLTYTSFVQEPRALKQVRYLKDAYEVTTAGYGPAPFADVRHIELPQIAPQRWGLLGRLLSLGLLVVRWYRPLTWVSALDRSAVELLGGGSWDLVIAHDPKTLEAALKLPAAHGVIVDLHEYAPRQEEQSFLWRLLSAPYYRWMCRVKVPQTAAVVTVGQGIADEYLREFGFDSVVVVNATPYHELATGPVSTPLRLVHSGSAAAQRRLDLLIEGVLSSSAEVTLDLYLVGAAAMIEQLRALAGDDPRIRFRDPVPYRELIQTLNGYDLGVHLLPPLNFNQHWALPNKFFDYVQARLGVIVGPSPEMARLVDEYGIGLVLPDFNPSSLAAALESLTAQRVAAFKAASSTNAVALSSESQAKVWADLTAGVLAASRAR